MYKADHTAHLGVDGPRPRNTRRLTVEDFAQREEGRDLANKGAATTSGRLPDIPSSFVPPEVPLKQSRTCWYFAIPLRPTSLQLKNLKFKLAFRANTSSLAPVHPSRVFKHGTASTFLIMHEKCNVDDSLQQIAGVRSGSCPCSRREWASASRSKHAQRGGSRLERRKCGLQNHQK